MMVLISNPNFLILDEPTNDLDLITLNRLEDFLMDFGGCLIIVSHDRFFMDKLVQHYFVFEGDGVIRDFNGTYQEWRQEQSEAEKSASSKSSSETKKSVTSAEKSSEYKGNADNSTQKIRTDETSSKRGMSFKERKEYQKLEKEIADLESEKQSLELEMSKIGLDYQVLNDLSARHLEVQDQIAEKELRWLELSELE
jgi:ATP-binding cassette subfamily F protein uup